MVREVRIYYEGDRALKPGFRAFLREIGNVATPRRWSIRLIEAKGRPVRDYHKARRANPDAWNVLLLDSEGAMISPAEHCERKGLSGLSDSVFWMVQCMESWFLADPGALKNYYGEDGFRESALKRNPSVEQIAKSDVLSCLRSATRETAKGQYHKTAHAPQLLEKIDPDLVRKASRNCDRLFQALTKRLAEA